MNPLASFRKRFFILLLNDVTKLLKLDIFFKSIKQIKLKCFVSNVTNLISLSISILEIYLLKNLPDPIYPCVHANSDFKSFEINKKHLMIINVSHITSTLFYDIKFPVI